MASDNGGSRGQRGCRIPGRCTLQQTLGAQEETSHTPLGNQERLIRTPVLAQQSHLQRLSPEPWCRPHFIADGRGLREKKTNGRGHLPVALRRQLGSWWMQEASKITEAKSMQGEYRTSDICLASFILLLSAFLLNISMIVDKNIYNNLLLNRIQHTIKIIIPLGP